MKVLKWLNSRFAYHVAGAFVSCEIILTLLLVCGVKGDWLMLAALSAPLTGIGREVIDHFKWHEVWYKHVYDVMSWSIGGCIWLTLKLLQG